MPPGSKKRRAARRKQQQQKQHASDSQDSQPSSPHPQGNGGALHDPNGSTDPSDSDRDSPRAPAPVNGGDADEVGVEFVGAADLAPPPEAAAVPAVSEVRVSEPAVESGVSVLSDVRVSEPAEVRVSEPVEESGVHEVRISEPKEEARVSEQAEEARVSGVSELRVSEPKEEARVSEPEPEQGAGISAAAAASVEPAVYVDVASEEVVQAVEDKAVLSENVVDVLVVSAVEKPRDVAVVGDEFPRVGGSEAVITEEAPPAPAPAPLIRRRAAWWNCCGLVEVVRGAEA